MNQSPIDEFKWKLFVQIRQEMMEAQRIRMQLISFKITFVSAGIGVVLAYGKNTLSQLLIIPALGALFFDLFIIAQNYLLDRLSFYCKDAVPENPIQPVAWESWLSSKPAILFKMGSIGITILAITPAYIALAGSFRASTLISLLLLIVLTLFTFYVISLYIRERHFVEKGYRREPI
jgi:hypothetical protein